MSCMHERLSMAKQRRSLLSSEDQSSQQAFEERNNQQMHLCGVHTASVKAASVTAVRAKDSSASSSDTAWDGRETHCSEQLSSASHFPGNTEKYYWLQMSLLSAEMQLSLPQHRKVNWSCFCEIQNFWSENGIFGVLKKEITSMKVELYHKSSAPIKDRGKGCHKTTTSSPSFQI